MPSKIITDAQLMSIPADGQVSLAVYLDAIQTFKDNFYPRNNQPSTWGQPFYFSLSEMEAVITDSGFQQDEAIVVFYHGLEYRNNEYHESYGLRVVKKGAELPAPQLNFYELSPHLNSAPGNVPSHLLDGNGIVAITSATTPSWSTRDADYKNEMLFHAVLNTPPSARLATASNYCRAILFPWEDELLAVYNANKGSHAHANLRFVVSGFCDPNIASLTTEEENFFGSDPVRHSLSVHIQARNNGNWRNQLNNNSSVTYAAKGVEYGNVCPPRCGDYYAR
jgi:hypothetical protein